MILRIIGFAAVSLCITLLIAVALILSQRPLKRVVGEGLDFQNTLARGVTQAQPLSALRMRDGYDLQFRHYAGPDADVPLVVLVHGSGWHGLQFDALARQLATQAEVLAPDLRGHGTAPGRRGDVDYIGQFEDDLADLITAHRGTGQKVILAGHSSGGGLVVRFAGGEHGGMLDGAVLLAPFLKHNAPTMRENAGGWSRVLLRRMIGLSMLNALRIRVLNHLTVIQFTMPDAVLQGPLGDTATTAYSYRLNTSFAPRADYLGDVARLPPFLLIAGAEDEAFKADLYQSTLEAVNGKGRYALLPDLGHLDVVNDARSVALIRGFIDEF